MTPSYPKAPLLQRLGIALASALITAVIVLGNLQLARHAAPATDGMRAGVAQGIVHA